MSSPRKVPCKSLRAMSQEEHSQAHVLRRTGLWCDFEICDGIEELSRMLHHINRYGYELVTVTQYKDAYTVFFRRAGA